MITLIRENILQGKFFKVAVGALAIAMLGIWSLPSGRGGDSAYNQWVVRVNGHKIGGRDFALKTRDFTEKLNAQRRQYGEYADMILQMQGISTDPTVLAFESLVDEQLLNQAASAVPVSVSPDYVGQQLANPNFVMSRLSYLVPMRALTRYGINQGALANFLQRQGMTMQSFEGKVEQLFKRDLFTDLVRSSYYLPGFAVRHGYRQAFAGKTFEVMTMSMASLIEQEKKAGLADGELDTFFLRERERYRVPQKRGGSVWVFKPENYGIGVSGDDIERYYEEHRVSKFVASPVAVQVRRILKEKLEDAQALHKELTEKPDTFAARAREVSDDAETLMAPFSRGTHEEVIERAALLLKADGDISDVVKTNRGYEFYQRVKKTPKTFKPLSDVRKDIAKTLLGQKFSVAFAQDMKKLIGNGNAPVDQQAVIDFAKQKKASLQVLAPQAKNDEYSIQTLFRLPEGGYDATQHEGNGVVVYLEAVVKSFIPELEAVTSAVESDLFEQRAARALAERIKQARTEVKDASLREVAQQSKAQFKRIEGLKSHDEDRLKKLQEDGLPAMKMLQLEKIGSVVTHQDEGHGYVVRLAAIEPFNQEKFEEKRAEIVRNMRQQAMQQLHGSFVASLYRNATIERNKDLFTV